MTILLALASLALAAPHDPMDYASLGTLNPASDLTVDTSALTITGGASFTGIDVGGSAVFVFDDVRLNQVDVTVTGSRPLVILSQSDLALFSASIDVSALGALPGPGGGASGAGPGAGPDGQVTSFGAGGAGFGGMGGSGESAILGGPAYGDLKLLLEGGSGGGSAGLDQGGAGGGALELGATALITVDALSALRANGGDASAYIDGAGGGSGGALLVHGASATLFGRLEANGGSGSSGIKNGGGGGGGHVCIATPAASPVVSVLGGLGAVGAADGLPGVECVGDADGDGYPFHLDCNDNEPTAYPGAPEIPGDGIDQTCNGYDADMGMPDVIPGDLVINEIMANPAAVDDTAGEWFEIANLLPLSIELEGLEFYDNGADSHVVSGSLIVEANSYVVLGVNGDVATNGGAPIDYVYDDFIVANGDDEVILAYNGVVLDQVLYDTSYGWTVWIGTSMKLDERFGTELENNYSLYWCTSATSFGAGDQGTPGAPNGECNLDLDGDGTSESLDCDDDDPTLNYNDADGDAWATCEGDCDDLNPNLTPADFDGDGFSLCTGDCDDYDPIAQPDDADNDGFTGCDGDCVDTDASVFPGAVEVPDNGLDDDCVGGDEVTEVPTGTGTATGVGTGTGTATGTATGATGTGTGGGAEDKGCGCSSQGSTPQLGWLALLGLVWRRRDA